MKFLNILEKNLKQVWKVWFAVSSSLFSILSIILSFLSWEDFGITKTSAKLIAFIIRGCWIPPLPAGRCVPAF